MRKKGKWIRVQNFQLSKIHLKLLVNHSHLMILN
jgi:hypothetical protein